MANRKRPTSGGKPRQTATEPPKRSFPIVPVVFVAIAAVLVAAIVLTGGEAESGDQFGDVDVTGAALAVYPPNGYSAINADPAVGETIPTISGVDLDGNAMTIGADGTPKAIAFLAHWCSHCQAEVPRVTEWIGQTGGIEGVDLVSVTTSIDPIRGNYPPDEWLRSEDWPAAAMRDDQSNSAHRAFGGGGFPYWVFVNGDGEVVARAAGERTTDELQTLMTLALEG